jgi:hypothetical protein
MCLRPRNNLRERNIAVAPQKQTPGILEGRFLLIPLHAVRHRKVSLKHVVLKKRLLY